MASFRQRNKRALKDSAGAALAAASLTTTEIFSENLTIRGDFFGIWVDVSSVVTGNVLVHVYHSEDGGTTWSNYSASVGAMTQGGTAADAGLPDISADGAAGAWWYNVTAQTASPESLIRFGFDMSAGTATLDNAYLVEGSLGGR